MSSTKPRMFNRSKDLLVFVYIISRVDRMLSRPSRMVALPVAERQGVFPTSTVANMFPAKSWARVIPSPSTTPASGVRVGLCVTVCVRVTCRGRSSGGRRVARELQ